VFERRERKISAIAEAVHEWPKFPGGTDAYSRYLKDLGRDMVYFLPDGVKKAFVQVEFIVDKDGVPVNFRVVRGTNDLYFMDMLVSKMQKMPDWQPAILNEKPVAKKMVQTIAVETEEGLAIGSY
jgi:hypothetical protein